MATHTDARSFSKLDPAIQKLEFKVTVLPPEEPKVQAELRRAGVSPARRKVYLYDTPASVEEWSLPDGTHFIELCFKVAPDEAEAAELAFHALLDRLTIGHNGDPDPKTPRVLKFFTERLC